MSHSRTDGSGARPGTRRGAVGPWHRSRGGPDFDGTRRAMVAVAIVLVLVIVQLVVVGAVVAGARDSDMTAHRLNSTRSFYAAEGAMNMAIREIIDFADDDNDGITGGISSDGLRGNDPEIGPSAFGSAIRTDGATTVLTADGRSGDSLRRITTSIVDGTRAGRRVIYCKWSNQSPQYRIWSGANWGAAADTLDFGGKQYWAVIRHCPTRDGVVTACSLQGHWLKAAVQTGPTWGNLVSAASEIGTVDQRPFSFAYEQASGNGLLVYRVNNSATIYYRIWNGTAWSAEQSAASPLTGQPMFMKLVPKHSSNEIMRYVLDSNSDIAAMVWNGASFGYATVLETNAAASVNECVDAAYERGTGRCMVLWSQLGSGVPRYAFWSGSAWTATATAPDLGSAPLWIHLASDPVSDKMIVGHLDASSRIFVNAWSGSAWGSNLRVTPVASTTGSRCFDVAFEPKGTRGVVLYGHSGSPIPRFNVYDGSNWGIQLQGPNLPNPPLLVQLTPSGGGHEIMCLMNVTGGQNKLEFLRWNGSLFVNYQELESNVSGPSGAEVFMIPDEPPVVVPQCVSSWTEAQPN